MKTITSICLSIFLVMGAVFLFSGCSQSDAVANEALISDLYTGHWVRMSQVEKNDNPYADYLYLLGHTSITSDGVLVTTGWLLVDHAKTGYTPSKVTTEESTTTFDNVTESIDPRYISFSGSFIDAEGLITTHSVRCYGSLESSIGYTQMQCISKVTLTGGPYELEEEEVWYSTMYRQSQGQP